MKKGSKWFWGIYFIVAAIAIVLNQYDYFVELNVISLAFIILMIPIIIKSALGFNWTGVLFPIAIMLIVFDEALGLGDLSVWPILLAATFGSIGLSFIASPRFNFKGNFEDNFANLEDVADDEIVNCFASFTSTIKYVNTDNYKKGNFKCSFGAMKIYFDNAKLSKAGGVINLDVSFSGVELYVPKEWVVINNCNCTLGGIDEKYNRGQRIENAPTLILTGSVSFAGVEIVYI